MIYLYALLCSLAATYMLWIFFLAVMSLKRAKDMDKLSSTAIFFGTPILVVGYLLDFFVNMTVMTVLLLEIPRETTVTSRLSRHNRESTGWRKAIAVWAEPLLDPYDPSGDHI